MGPSGYFPLTQSSLFLPEDAFHRIVIRKGIHLFIVDYADSSFGPLPQESFVYQDVIQAHSGSVGFVPIGCGRDRVSSLARCAWITSW